MILVQCVKFCWCVIHLTQTIATPESNYPPSTPSSFFHNPLPLSFLIHVSTATQSLPLAIRLPHMLCVLPYYGSLARPSTHLSPSAPVLLCISSLHKVIGSANWLWTCGCRLPRWRGQWWFGWGWKESIIGI